jgi:hypothetical protein
MSRLRRALAISAAAGAVVALGVSPALAQPSAAPTVSIGVKSLVPTVYGYTVVPFKDGKYSRITVSGAVTGATSGMVAQLYARPFPYKTAAAPVTGQQLALTGTSPQSYSFTATPGIATRYSVEILPGATVSSPVAATSAIKTTYVATNQKVTGVRTCNRAGGRPVCHQTIHIYTRLPASGYRAEAPKKLYFYLGLKLSATGEPKPPVWLTLDRSAKVAKAKRISATEFEQTVTFSFRIGNRDGYYFLVNFCTKASESKDGVNLPGHHHCGATRINVRWFLG